MTLKTKFDLNQKVWITELKVPGRVLALYLGKHGALQYFVRYFRPSQNPESEYFFEDELSANIPTEPTAGFGGKAD